MTLQSQGKAVAKPDLAAGPLFRLACRSQSLIPADRLEAELAQILRGARAKNSEFKATGALMFYADWFAQLLEGAEDVVKLLYERIKRDPRHDSVQLLEEGAASKRSFGKWAMAHVGDMARSTYP